MSWESTSLVFSKGHAGYLSRPRRAETTSKKPVGLCGEALHGARRNRPSSRAAEEKPPPRRQLGCERNGPARKVSPRGRLRSNANRFSSRRDALLRGPEQFAPRLRIMGVWRGTGGPSQAAVRVAQGINPTILRERAGLQESEPGVRLEIMGRSSVFILGEEHAPPSGRDGSSSAATHVQPHGVEGCESPTVREGNGVWGFAGC
jgi:hypothetical protein